MSRGRISAISSFANCVAVSDGKLHMVSYNAENDNPNQDTTVHKFAVQKSDINDKSNKAVNGDTPLRLSGNNQREVKAAGVVEKGTFLTYAR